MESEINFSSPFSLSANVILRVCFTCKPSRDQRNQKPEYLTLNQILLGLLFFFFSFFLLYMQSLLVKDVSWVRSHFHTATTGENYYMNNCICFFSVLGKLIQCAFKGLIGNCGEIYRWEKGNNKAFLLESGKQPPQP